MACPAANKQAVLRRSNSAGVGLGSAIGGHGTPGSGWGAKRPNSSSELHRVRRRSGGGGVQSLPRTCPEATKQAAPWAAKRAMAQQPKRAQTVVQDACAARRGNSKGFRSKAVELRARLRAQVAQVLEGEGEPVEMGLIGDVTPAQMKVYSKIFEAVIESDAAYAPVLRRIKDSYDSCVKSALDVPCPKSPAAVALAARLSALRGSLEVAAPRNERLEELELENRKLRQAAGRLHHERREREAQRQKEEERERMFEEMRREKAQRLAQAQARAESPSESSEGEESQPPMAREAGGEQKVGEDEGRQQGEARRSKTPTSVPPIASMDGGKASGMSVGSKGVRMEPWSGAS